MGGAAVAVVAHMCLSELYEYPIALILMFATVGWGRRASVLRWFRSASKIAIVASLSVFVLIAYRWVEAETGREAEAQTLEVNRSLYGLYRVIEAQRVDAEVRDLVSGGTRHGRQRVGDPEPLSYYHREGPLGEVVATVQPLRFGVVGLGAGAAAAYAGPQRFARFFEIDPVVVDLAQQHFSYLSRAGDAVDITVDDARLALAREVDELEPRYDLLLIDAFAGDAVLFTSV